MGLFPDQKRTPFSRQLSVLARTQHPATPTTLSSFSSPAAASSAYASLLRQCAATRSLAGARAIHLHIIRTGFPFLGLGNKLVDAYLKCDVIDDARKLFDEMPKPHIVSWNSMISSYVRHGRSGEALRLFRRMLVERIRADEYTFSPIFRAFADEGLLLQGRTAHGQLVVSGMDGVNGFVGSALVDMYAKFRRLRDARLVFDRLVEKDVVLVTALVVGYAQNGDDQEAIRVFGEMMTGGDVRPNEFTFASILIACGNQAEFTKGQQIHGAMVKSGFDSNDSPLTSLLVMYSKCGLVDESLKIFSKIRRPNTVTWTAVIGVLVSNHREEHGLSMFCDMLRCSAVPNEFTLSTAYRACSSLALFVTGQQIHAHTVKVGLDRHRFIAAALIDMYGKCGRIKIARSVFDSLTELDVVSVNSMINCYAQNGCGNEAIRLFDHMQSSSLDPNDATFTSVLAACSNAGLLEDGRRIFSLIPSYCKTGPSKDHHACLVDLLGRVGSLREAEVLIETQVKSPDIILWRTLLSACKIHGEVEVAERVAKKILELSPGDDGTHILLSNIYAHSGQWQEVIRMKKTMRAMKLKKEPAMTWVEINKEVHTFMAGDKSHPRSGEIHDELGKLMEKTKAIGYIPDTRFVLQELDKVEKERSLYYHSEKLAIAFAMLNRSNGEDGGRRIVIFKNLRVCGDCHAWIKLVTKVVRREITARDTKRFHHFKDGLCSCGDFW